MYILNKISNIFIYYIFNLLLDDLLKARKHLSYLENNTDIEPDIQNSRTKTHNNISKKILFPLPPTIRGQIFIKYSTICKFTIQLSSIQFFI